ncbi:MAG: hypothetical protein H0W56_09685 [Acidothermales bacterium]|nr:hypothetical protein [Acidothermales bacterium]
MGRVDSGATAWPRPAPARRRRIIGGRIPVSLALVLVVAAVDAILLGAVLAGRAADPTIAPPSVPAAATAREAPSRQPLLDLADASFAVESRTLGSCAEGGAELRVTEDGGRTWVDIPSPTAAVFSVSAPQPRMLAAVGANARCTARPFRSADLGQTWTRAPDTVGIWYAGTDANGTAILHSPAGDIESPCASGAPVRHLEGISLDRGFALCAGEPIYRTGDSGRFWQAGQPVSAVAISFPSSTTGFAATTDDPECPGIRLLVSDDAGLSWANAACVADAEPVTEVGLDFVDGVTGMLRAGSDTFVTDDGGATWTRP